MSAAFTHFREGLYAFPKVLGATFAAYKAIVPLIMSKIFFAIFRCLEGIAEFD